MVNQLMADLWWSMKPDPWNRALVAVEDIEEAVDEAVTAAAAGITEEETEVATAAIIPEGVIGDY